MPSREQRNTSPVRTISDFKSKLSGGGARPNLFEVELAFPTAAKPANQTEVLEKARFLVKAAALPASTIASVDVPFRGRILKVAGDRTIDTWQVTVINDENFGHRRAFEAWMQNISQYGDSSGLTDPSAYMGQAQVFQLGRTAAATQGTGTASGPSNILAQYKFVDIFPTAISDIALSYDTPDAIEEFTVEFQVQYYFPETPGSGA